MSDTSLIAATLAITLLRGAKLSLGRVVDLLRAMPADAKADGALAMDWYNEHFATQETRIDLNHWGAGRKSIDATIKSNIVPIEVGSPLYPTYLAAIHDPPPVLFVKGNVDLLRRGPGVAIVGTRKASKNGLVIAERIANYFAEQGWTIVSGLAMGIDAAAHRGTLNVGGATIAVLAHGLRAASPKLNAHLGAEILEKGGAWVSEYPVDVLARPEQFVLRNRIQIGLSAGSIIVEGEERSGTMTQAEYCLRNKRKLFAVLPERADLLKLVSEGPLILINKRGATPLRSREDYAAAANAMEQIKPGIMTSSAPA